jgi:hypothetical protein
MRTKKELLQLMLDNIDLLSAGLCHLNYKLFDLNMITENEYYLLDHFFLNEFSDFDYHWKMGLKEPRIEWLKKQINEL